MTKKTSVEAKALVMAELQIKKLEKENKQLKMANTILKEVAKVFSKDPLDSSLSGSKESKPRPDQKPKRSR